MHKEFVELVEKRSDALFEEFGFKPILINEIKVYEHKGNYHKLSFVQGLSAFVIEYADSFNSAKSNLYEDGEVFPVSLGESELIELLRDTLTKYFNRC